MVMVHTTPADSDTRTTKVRDSMMLPSMRVTVGLLEWSSYEVIMVQCIVDLSTQPFFCHRMVQVAAVVSRKFVME